MTSSEGDFTTEEGKKLLKEIADFSKPVVVLSGGEPLVRRNVMSLVRSLSRHLSSGALDELTRLNAEVRFPLRATERYSTRYRRASSFLFSDHARALMRRRVFSLSWGNCRNIPRTTGG